MSADEPPTPPRTPRKILGMNARKINDRIVSSNNLPSSMETLIDRRQYANLVQLQAENSGFWPYGQYIPSGINVLPPQIALPIYYHPTTSTATSSGLHQPQTFDGIFHNRQMNNGVPMQFNEPKAMTIQIGLQCVNQSNSVNINSPNEIGIQNYTNSGIIGDSHQASYLNTQFNDTKPTAKSSPTMSHSPKTIADSDNCDDSLADYITSDVPIITKDVITQEQFTQLTKMAMYGCELAENLAHTHRSRPCFKKIDSLCARMKQDLVRPDSVLANINSQGIAWAVKDFIFVFTRIVSAWIIIKGYVYNTPDGLNKVKSTLCEDFNNDFANWQESTIKFIDSIIKSFVNLDEMVQSQRAAYQKNDSGTNKTTSTKNSNKDARQSATNRQTVNSTDQQKRKSKSTTENSMEYLRDLFLLSDSMTSTSPKTPSPQKSINDLTAIQSIYNNVMENSEETQLRAVETGKYFKTGLYNPLKKDSSRTIESKSIFTNTATTAMPPQNNITNNYDLTYLEPIALPENMDLKISRSFENLFIANNEPEKRITVNGNFFDDNVNHNAMTSLPPIGSEKKYMSNDSSPIKSTDDNSMNEIGLKKIEYLLEKITNLNESNYFFNAQFTNNYFPNFNNIAPYFIDIRSILLKFQKNDYTKIDNVVHDLRQIVYCGRIYLQKHSNVLMQNTIQTFEQELDTILSQSEFAEYDFKHITGVSDEIY